MWAACTSVCGDIELLKPTVGNIKGIIIGAGKSAPLMIDRNESICCDRNRVKEKWFERGLPVFHFDLFYLGEKLVDNQTVHEC